MPSNPDISIIVPAYNAEGTLAGCLQAILDLRLSEPYEVILVDDGSADGTAAIAERFAPRVKVLRQAHKGAGAARNAGIEIARGDIILFTDADCEPVPGWGTVMLAALHGGADGAKGTYRTRQRSLIARFVQAEYESKYSRMEGRTYIDFVDTYSAAYRRKALLESSGFNESLPVDEDQELSFRLARTGHRLVYVPEAVVYHLHVTSPLGYVRRKFRIGYWKVFVGAIHPKRVVSDSHTPQSMKLEMLLVAATLSALAVSPAIRPARKVSLTCGLGFILATLPFALRVATKDPAVAAIAPAMLLLRALGLGCGVLAGTLRLGLIHLRNGKVNQVQ
jgi:glycosyltransferase involved in cell wall biosynthesis